MATNQSGLRSFLAGLLGAIGVVLVPITLLASWTEEYLFNTENFVSLYQPVSGKSSFQQYLAVELSDAASQAVIDSGAADIAGSVTGGIDGFLGQFGVDLGLQEATDNWTQQLGDLVGGTVYEEALPALQSPQFTEAWSVAVTQVHSQVMEGLEGDGPETQTLVLQGDPFVEIMQDYLGDRGFFLAQQLPTLAADTEVPLVEITYTPAARTFVDVLGKYAGMLPWLTGGFLVAGILLARKPWAAMARAGFASAFLAGALWLSVPHLGARVLSDVAGTLEDGSIAELLWATGVSPLLSQSLLVAGVALAVGILGLVVNLLIGSYRE